MVFVTMPSTTDACIVVYANQCNKHVEIDPSHEETYIVNMKSWGVILTSEELYFVMMYSHTRYKYN
jgi:hypothetical protein